jgi:hypothetical protein
MDGRQSLKKPYAPGQCASTHRRLHRQILQGMVLPGHRFLSSICCVRSPIGCVPSSSSLFPISLHSTTSFSLVEKSKYPPSAQQKGRTRMSGFESQSAHNGAQSGTPSRRSPHTPQVQWKRALPLFSSHQGSSRVEVVRARQPGFVQEAGGDHSVTTLSAGPWCGPSFPCLLRDNPVGPTFLFRYRPPKSGRVSDSSQISPTRVDGLLLPRFPPVSRLKHETIVKPNGFCSLWGLFRS